MSGFHTTALNHSHKRLTAILITWISQR